MRSGRIVPVLAIVVLAAVFLLAPRLVTAESDGAVSLDVKDPLSLTCSLHGGYSEVTIHAADTVTNLQVTGFSIPIDALKAGWSITLAKEGQLGRVTVRALWRGKTVEKTTLCK